MQTTELQTREELIKEISYLMLCLQRRARFIRQKISFPLNATESIFLSLISTSSFTTSQAAQTLSISLNRATNLFQKLASLGIIALEKQQQDARVTIAQITEYGKTVKEELLQVNLKIGELTIEPLTGSERARLVSYLHEVASAMGAPEEELAAGESLILSAHRRLSKATNIASDNAFGTGLPILNIHLLSELARASKCAFSWINSVLPFDAAIISRALTKLESQHLVEKHRSSDNKKEVILRLTDEGRREHLKAARVIWEKYSRATRSLDNSTISDYRVLLAKIAGAPLPQSVLTVGSLSVVIADTTVLRKKARGYLVETLVKENLHDDLDEALIPRSSFCCMLTEDKTIKGLIEVTRGKKVWSLASVIYTTSLPTSKRRDFFKSACSLLFNKTSCSQVRVKVSSFKNNEFSTVFPQRKHQRDFVLTKESMQTLFA